MLNASDLGVFHSMQCVILAPISWQEKEPHLIDSLQKLLGGIFFEIEYIDPNTAEKVLYLRGPGFLQEKMHSYPAKQIKIRGLRLLVYYWRGVEPQPVRRKELNAKLKFIAERLAIYFNASYSLLKNSELEKAGQSSLSSRAKKLEQELLRLNNEYAEKIRWVTQEEELILQNEKLNAIGEITPILAHEIKTPLSAMQGALLNFCNTFPAVLRELVEYIHTLSPVENDLFWQLLDCIKDPNSKVARKEINEMAQKINFSTRQQRKYTREVRRELEKFPLNNPEEIAEKFVKIGFTREPLHLFSLFPRNFEKTIDTLYSLATLWRQMQILKNASQKSQKIVKALNAYVGQPNARVPISVVETIEIVLTLYNYYLEQGIELDTFWQELPLIMANPQELIQVWTDLIMNAVYAMEGSGMLKITATLCENVIHIAFEDSGPQIMPEKIPYVFDPGVITRKGEEKVGIGLFNCKQIIQKHNGELMVESSPAKTCFLVKLPVVLPPSTVTSSELKVPSSSSM